MSAFASFAGLRVVAGSIAIPLYGMWSGDITLAADTAPPFTGALVLGDLSLAGFVYREANFAGSVRARVAAGFGGWHKTVASKHYALASGVARSMILRDVAAEVGELVNVPTDYTVPNYVRRNAPASDVLRRFASPDWYIDGAGVTQVQAWPVTRIASSFTVIDQDGAQGLVEVATETYADWMPGRTFASPFLKSTLQNAGVRFDFAEDGTFRLHVLTVPAP